MKPYLFALLLLGMNGCHKRIQASKPISEQTDSEFIEKGKQDVIKMRGGK